MGQDYQCAHPGRLRTQLDPDAVPDGQPRRDQQTDLPLPDLLTQADLERRFQNPPQFGKARRRQRPLALVAYLHP